MIPFRPIAAAVILLSGAALADTPAGVDPSAYPLPDAEPTVEEPHVPKYIFAREDTLDVPAQFKMSTIEVRADRLEIGDIVRRCIEREEELAASIRSHDYTQLVKTVGHIGGYGEDAKSKFVIEQADRIQWQKEGPEKTIPLKLDMYKLVDGEREKWEDEDPVFEVGYEELNELPFYLEDRSEYDFEILSRQIVGNRVIYEVALEPRSDFEIAPSGRIWVDTTNFQILREEFDFGDRVPFPLLIKSCGPFVRERERIGELWVWSRMLARIELKTRLMRIFQSDFPDVVEFVITFEDHELNAVTLPAVPVEAGGG